MPTSATPRLALVQAGAFSLVGLVAGVVLIVLYVSPPAWDALRPAG